MHCGAHTHVNIQVMIESSNNVIIFSCRNLLNGSTETLSMKSTLVMFLKYGQRYSLHIEQNEVGNVLDIPFRQR